MDMFPFRIQLQFKEQIRFNFFIIIPISKYRKWALSEIQAENSSQSLPKTLHPVSIKRTQWLPFFKLKCKTWDLTTKNIKDYRNKFQRQNKNTKLLWETT